jgi:hypothetical protein
MVVILKWTTRCTLCKYHHKELHKGAFYLSLRPESVKSKAANPTKFTCAYHSFSELVNTLDVELSEPITEKTAVTKWAGERMDLGVTIEGLLNASKWRGAGVGD